ncbi:hypothetical protein HPB48_017007 [Haemaphysalis longicornis]|uniref:Uncharacterized protein n=1 Tax=Haemaphysalis longicornis TaxID=44386 RepID=A0A9J6G6F1_HAELO|nr:hypothetical protein HPB48_017007 [Haemaphysalis longicornis]
MSREDSSIEPRSKEYVLFGVVVAGWPERRRRRDNLCYLTHGGSSETFTVNEAFPVESIVGSLQVVGNASEPYGDIELRMADPESSPLAILPGTKSLVLRQKLDKEGRDGLRSVTTDVICSPRHTRQTDHLVSSAD